MRGKAHAGPLRGIGKYVPNKPQKTHLTYEDFYPTGLANYGEIPDPTAPQTSPYVGTPHKISESQFEHPLNSKTRLYRPSQKKVLPPLRRTQAPKPKKQVFTSDTDMTPDEARCLEILNRYRRENNLKPLTFSRKLSAIIEPHNHRCALKEVPVGHDGFHERAKQIPKMKRAGENVGMCRTRFDYIEILMQRWMESEHHRVNILGDFNKVGMAFEQNSQEEWFGSHLFAKVPV